MQVGSRCRVKDNFPNKAVRGDIVTVLGVGEGRHFPIRTTVPISAPKDCVHLNCFRFREDELEVVGTEVASVWPQVKQDAISDMESSR